jgi:hypothetical protein
VLFSRPSDRWLRRPPAPVRTPRDYQRDRETDDDCEHNQPHGPVPNFKEWKDLRRYLHQQPCDDCVGDRNFVNVAPLQLGEEFLWVHGKLLVNGFRLGFGKEFLKTWIVADRVPDRVDL